MTIRTDCRDISEKLNITTCGKPACIVLYTSDYCPLCHIAREIIEELLAEFGLALSLLVEVDISEGFPYSSDLHGLFSLPAVQICNEVMNGLPQIDDARGHLMNAVLRGCFVTE
jgi:hypothetical protein